VRGKGCWFTKIIRSSLPVGINFTADYDADNASTLAPVKPPLEVNWFRVVLATLVSWMTSESGFN